MESGYLLGKEMAWYVRYGLWLWIDLYLLHCQVLLWEVTQNGIELASQLPSQSHPCFEVAGQVNSIDTNGEYAAVGSTVVQLVKLTDFALNKRILLHKSMKSMVLF
jgi:hypothetical protein